MRNEFSLQDFLDQLQKIRSMGPLGKVMGMIPGMSKLQTQADFNDDDIEKRVKESGSDHQFDDAIREKSSAYFESEPQASHSRRKVASKCAM